MSLASTSPNCSSPLRGGEEEKGTTMTDGRRRRRVRLVGAASPSFAADGRRRCRGCGSCAWRRRRRSALVREAEAGGGVPVQVLLPDRALTSAAVGGGSSSVAVAHVVFDVVLVAADTAGNATTTLEWGRSVTCVTRTSRYYVPCRTLHSPTRADRQRPPRDGRWRGGDDDGGDDRRRDVGAAARRIRTSGTGEAHCVRLLRVRADAVS